jgi:hypothetical protein
MKNLIAILTICTLTTIAFNNCSEVGFSQAEKSTATSTTNTDGGVSRDGLGGLSDDDLLKRLPPEEQDMYRPISDLEDHPEIIPIYTCPDGQGIILCHFPASYGSEHTLCVGSVNAAMTHSGHELTFDANNNPQGDYLGPCK